MKLSPPSERYWAVLPTRLEFLGQELAEVVTVDATGILGLVFPIVTARFSAIVTQSHATPHDSGPARL